MSDVPFDYVWPEALDRNTQQLVKSVREHIDEADDDFRLFIVGETGTGKSMLNLHFTEGHMGDEADIALVGLTQQDYATAVKTARDLRLADMKNVVCVYDEANIFSTEMMKKFTNRAIELLATIRGLNIFHIWAMPNPRRLPDDFTAEMFNGVIFIVSKNKDGKPRVFYYWSKKNLNKLREKTGSEANPAKITFSNLRKWRKFADWKGCFRDYDGFLKPLYLAKKRKKMSEYVDGFFKDFGQQKETIGLTEASRRLDVSVGTMYKYFDEAKGKGLLNKDEDFIVSGAGEVKVFPESLNKLRKEPIMKGL